ncbi:hypothetical protein Q5P01_020517 [Channa striata]|uniref:Uncharacterized protein n=1 Tax=Channa striata TaxID=64152 RepID=A0AA88LXT3_CHASR|nr:hypothetical protein Q5P01_020517 [Channa striata]
MDCLWREKHRMIFAIDRVLDETYAALPTPSGQTIQMILINLRNRPLSRSNISSMSQSILSLYHSLITGAKDFPVISCESAFISSVITTPFPNTKHSQKENNMPCPLMLQPAGVVVPAEGSGSSPPITWTPVHPEKAELRALRADRRNCVRIMEFYGSSFTRVISPVYRTDGSELTNCWRVTDYSADGNTLMSVHCRFNKETTRFAAAQREWSGGEEDDSSSSLPPPRMHLRL